MNSLIVKHLVDFTPVKMVYVITDLVDYFKRLGFVGLEERKIQFLWSIKRITIFKKTFKEIL